MSFDTDEGYRKPVVVLGFKNDDIGTNIKRFLLKIIFVFLTIRIIYETYISYTTPMPKYLAFYWIFYLIFGPPGSILLILVSLRFLNFKCIEVYKDKIVQRVRIGWLPPFNRSIDYEPKKIKIDLDVQPGVDDRFQYIIFRSKANHMCSRKYGLLFYLYLEFLCKNIICVGFGKRHARFFYNINDILKFLDFLIENVEDDGNRKKLQKFREEVLQWENK